MKVSVIGAGNVGATLAQRIAEADLADVVLLDIAGGIAKGKSYDLADARSIIGHDRSILGTDNYEDIAGSSIVVVTAGLARQPGMTREDLIAKNTQTIKKVVQGIAAQAPGSIIIMVTNPLDILTNIALKISGFDSKKVVGMGGMLDSSRFVNIISEELDVPPSKIEALVIGAHGKGMLPIARLTKVNGKPLTEMADQQKVDYICEATVKRGAQIVKCLGKGSAYYAPSAAAFQMVKSIITDSKLTVPACAYLDGEYGIEGVCIGVPIVLGKNGIEEVWELDLKDDELNKLKDAAAAVKTAVTGLL